MRLTKKDAKDILKKYNIGSLKTFRFLGEGHGSTNYLLTLDSGKYVLKRHYHPEKEVDYITKAYDHLVSHGIKTSKPIPTKEGKLYIKYKKMPLNIQTFLDGKSKPNLSPKIYGEGFGQAQTVLAKFKIKRGRTDLQNLKVRAKYLPDDSYIHKQYEEFKNEIKDYILGKYTKATINSDAGADDFLFKGNKFIGILDFSDVHWDYVVYDVAVIMMYSHIFQKNKQKQYKEFIKAYLKEFPLPKEELKSIKFFLRMRLLLQIAHHWRRYKLGVSRGTGTVENNLKGVRDGKQMLKQLEKVPKDFYMLE